MDAVTGLSILAEEASALYVEEDANVTCHRRPTDNRCFNASDDDRPPASSRDVSYVCTCYDFLIEAVLMGLLCVFGFAGNIASTVVLSKDRSKTATPFLLVSLEVADTLFLVTVMALRVVTSIETFGYPVPGLVSVVPYLGKFIYPSALLTETGTIYLTILVTLNRYIAVCHPYDASDLCSVTFARRHVAIVWLFSIVFNLPRFFEYEITDDVIEGIRQTWLFNNTVYKVVYKNLFYFVVMFLVPLVSLTFLNIKLIKALRQTKRRRARLLLLKQPLEPPSNQPTGTGGGASSRSEDDITFMLIVVVMVFVVTQTPAMMTQVVASSFDSDHLACPSVFFYYERLSDLFVVANSSLNFIIYCFCSRRFREILIGLLCQGHSRSPGRSRDGVTAVHPVPLNAPQGTALLPTTIANEVSNI